MTPTTTEQAKVNPWWVDELTLHWGHGHSSHDTRRAAKTAIDQIEAITKERDSIAACYEAREEEAHQLSERIIKLTKERDALALCVDQWRVDYHELRLERDALAAAGKLALDALNKHGSPYLGHIDEYQQGAEALRQAGLQ